MVTASYVNSQAYKEIVEDGHPIVLVTGKTIIVILFDKYEIHTVEALKSWLVEEYSLSPLFINDIYYLIVCSIRCNLFLILF